jgi:hypothetical protein
LIAEFACGRNGYRAVTTGSSMAGGNNGIGMESLPGERGFFKALYTSGRMWTPLHFCT